MKRLFLAFAVVAGIAAGFELLRRRKDAYDRWLMTDLAEIGMAHVSDEGEIFAQYAEAGPETPPPPPNNLIVFPRAS